MAEFVPPHVYITDPDSGLMGDWQPDRAFWRHVFAGLNVASILGREDLATVKSAKSIMEAAVNAADALLAALGWKEEGGE